MRFAEGHALLVGVGSYEYHPGLDVPATAADAVELASVLSGGESCGYPPEQVAVLHDASATRESILRALDDLAERARERDTVVLFYCGHGDYGEDGQYYLTSHDTRIAGRKVASGAGVSQQELLAKLQAIRARRVLLLFNACYSGAVTPTLGGDEPAAARSLPDEIGGALLATGVGRVIITACRADQRSYVGDGARTIFAQALIDGLRGGILPNPDEAMGNAGPGAIDRAGYISAFDLYTYVYTTVSTRVQIDYQAAQEPELTILKGVGPFAVALAPRQASGGRGGEAERPAALPTGAIREVDPDASRALLKQIQLGGLSFGQQNSVSVQGSVVAGDQHTHTVGRDYTIDQRRIVVNSGGMLGGTVIGSVESGSIVNIGAAPSDTAIDPLRRAIAQVQQMVAQADQRGDEDLALDLRGALLSLQAALKAQQEGKSERRSVKLREGRAALEQLAGALPELAEVIGILTETE